MLPGVPPLNEGPFVLVYSSSTQNRNVKTDAIAAGWDQLRSLYVQVNAGVIISSAAGAGPALQSGALGMPWFLANLGSIEGYGGAGAQEGQANAPGGTGGDAISTQTALTIDNTSGNILGGGGGGGAGQLGATNSDSEGSAGGNGGGGQGNAGGAGTAPRNEGTGNNSGSAAGTPSGPAAGGTPGPPANVSGAVGGNGGAGGAWGQPGASGSAATASKWAAASAGGAAGFAVRKNGNTVTFTAGNNGTQVKGSVA